MKQRSNCRILMMVIMILLLGILCISAATGEAEVMIDETNFPDDLFREYVEQFDKDASGELSENEIRAVDYISVYAKGIKTLQGIEYFTSLKELDCSENKLVSLDVSALANLEELECYNCGLTSIDVSHNTKLTYLHLQENKLTTLDVRKNNKLGTLYCDDNKLTSLTLGSHPNLSSFGCEHNALTMLDVTGCPALEDMMSSGKPGVCAVDSSRSYFGWMIPADGWPDACFFFDKGLKLLTTGGLVDTGDNTARVGVSMPTQSLQRWAQDGSTMKSQLEAAGYEVELQYAVNDPSVQADQIKSMIYNGCSVLVIAPVESEALGSVLSEAQEKGVLVLAYDRLLMNTEAVNYYITFDNFKVGVQQANYIKSALGLGKGGGPYTIEFTAGDPADNNAELFYNGAMSVLKPYLDSGELEVRSGKKTFTAVATAGWRTDNAQKRAAKILSAQYPDGKGLDAWLCSNDSTATGVIQALEKAGYKDKWPVITGQDCDVMNVKYMIVGKQGMSVFKETSKLAKQAVKMVKQMLGGQVVDVNDTETYYNNVRPVPAYLCNPTTVTAGNYKKILIDSGIYDASLFTDLPSPPPGQEPEDGITAFVTRCYQLILGRQPDAHGLETWYNNLNSGIKAAAEIIDSFVRSNEFKGKNLSNADAVEILYKTMLGRGSDPAGKANWVAKLNAGQPLAAVINGFCGSNEFKAICESYGIRPGSVDVPEEVPTTPDEKIKAFVKRCYKIILGRGADEVGLNNWFRYLKTKQKAASEIIDGFVNSPEFLGKKYSNEESVEILYKAMLGRGSDPKGKANWVAKLNAGQPFAVVINGFCKSQEFMGLCESYGIIPGSVKVKALSGQTEEELSYLALNAEEPIMERSAANPNRVSIINPSDTVDLQIGTAVQAVYINEEKAKEFVSRCYQYILGRNPNGNELANWVNQMTNGTKTADQIARGFLFSDEFRGRNIGNMDLVKILYRVYLNREADPAGLASWTAKLDSGIGLKELLDTLVKTAEYKNVISEMGK